MMVIVIGVIDADRNGNWDRASDAEASARCVLDTYVRGTNLKPLVGALAIYIT